MNNTYNLFFEHLKNLEIEMVDFRFVDLNGKMHYITLPVQEINEKVLTEGIAFDSSSISGWNPIHQSDMLMVPEINEDLSNVYQDFFAPCPSVFLFCKLKDTNKNYYAKDPRYLAEKAEDYLKTLGVADSSYFGAELEFFIFDSVQFSNDNYSSHYFIDGNELDYHNMDENNLGYRIKHKQGYVPTPPLDNGREIRTEICHMLKDMNIHVERHHHEVAPCQHEIGIRFNTLKTMADHMQIYKYVTKNIAFAHKKSATFMPKPIFNENGSGMHVHQSLWKNNLPIFYDSNTNKLSEIALYYIGGIFKHIKSLNAFTNPTTNSYKRLVPGYEAPTQCAYAYHNRSAACRIPAFESAAQCRVEMRFPDPSANGYLALSAMLMAGIDGIKNKILPEYTEKNLYEESNNHQTIASSLKESIEALKNDHAYLLEGNIFTKELLESYIGLKEEEIKAYDIQPKPIEFDLYYTI